MNLLNFLRACDFDKTGEPLFALNISFSESPFLSNPCSLPDLVNSAHYQLPLISEDAFFVCAQTRIHGRAVN